MAENERYFELRQGTSNKFWCVRLSGGELSVRFGRIGSAGQEKAKAHASPADARREAERLIKEKLGKGYRERSAGASRKASSRARPKPKGETKTKHKPKTQAGPSGRSFEQIAKALGFKYRNTLRADWCKQMLQVSGLSRLPPSYLEYLRFLRGVEGWVPASRRGSPNYLLVFGEPALVTEHLGYLKGWFEQNARSRPKHVAKYRSLRECKGEVVEMSPIFLDDDLHLPREIF